MMGVGTFMRDQSGQMVVELAVCAPVMLALAIVCIDLMVYLGDCARFDRVASQEVAALACAPSGESYSVGSQAALIEAAVTESMGSADRLSCSVSATNGVDAGEAGEGLPIVSFGPQLATFTCTMTFTPWPFANGAFGVIPVELTHTRTYVVDPYRPGVVV